MAIFKNGWPEIISRIKIKTPFDLEEDDFWRGNYLDGCMFGIKVILSIPLFPFWVVGLVGSLISEMSRIRP